MEQLLQMLNRLSLLTIVPLSVLVCTICIVGINPIARFFVHIIPQNNYISYEAACYLFFHPNTKKDDIETARNVFRAMAKDPKNPYAFKAAERIWMTRDLDPKMAKDLLKEIAKNPSFIPPEYLRKDLANSNDTKIARTTFRAIVQDVNHPDAVKAAEKLRYSDDLEDQELAKQFYAKMSSSDGFNKF